MRHQPLDLAFGEIAPFNCQVCDGWWVFLGCRFHRDKMLLPNAKWITNVPFLHSHEGRIEKAHRTVGNPGGSPEATRRAFNKRFLLDLAEDWQQHGREVFKRVRRESPASYLKVCAML